MYAITFQGNCVNCSSSQVHLITQPFVETLQKKKSIRYELVSIYETGNCEIMHCRSFYELYGTTLVIVLVKSSLKISDVFKQKIPVCSKKNISYEQMGIALIGFTMSNKKLCFGGIHLALYAATSEKKCFVDF